jgi:hypothetical protein
MTAAQPVRPPKPEPIIPMKTTRSLLATALFVGLATLSLAGPGPQFWAQQVKKAPGHQTKADTQTTAASDAAKAPKACANCNCPAMMKS